HVIVRLRHPSMLETKKNSLRFENLGLNPFIRVGVLPIREQSQTVDQTDWFYDYGNLKIPMNEWGFQIIDVPDIIFFTASHYFLEAGHGGPIRFKTKTLPGDRNWGKGHAILNVIVAETVGVGKNDHGVVVQLAILFLGNLNRPFIVQKMELTVPICFMYMRDGSGAAVWKNEDRAWVTANGEYST
ncbi:hypothetical protein ACJX0J_040941, partial [Zea mays]